MTTQELKQSIEKVLGNSIRCLLPSYWWKRLFNQVVDRIEDVEQSTSQLIDSKVEEVKMPIVESVDELEKLDARVGDIASVGVESLEVVSAADLKESDSATFLDEWDSLTRIYKVELGEPFSEEGRHVVVMLHSKKQYLYDGIMLMCENGEFTCALFSYGDILMKSLDEINERLQNGDYRYLGGSYPDVIDKTYKLYVKESSANAYIKGASWERLAKESDLVSGDDNVVIIYANEESTRNTNAFNTIIDCYENETPYVAVVKIDEMLYSANITIQKVNDRYGIMAQCINTARNKFYGVLFGLSVETGVGLAILLTESELITIDSELSDTSENAVQNKVVTAAIEELKNSNAGIISRTVYPTKTVFFGTEKDNEISETEREYNCETFRMAANNVIQLKGDTNVVVPLLALTEESATFGLFKYQAVIGPEKMFVFASYVIDKDGNAIVEVEMAESEYLISTINNKADKSDIKTLNGVSLLGGGNLQLGDGQTIVYDDTEVKEVAYEAKALANLAIENLEALQEELNENIFEQLSQLMKDLDDLSARVRALENK